MSGAPSGSGPHGAARQHEWEVAWKTKYHHVTHYESHFCDTTLDRNFAPFTYLTEGRRCSSGHFALGFAAKKAAPRTSLATLFVAAQLADILWPFVLALGVEQVVIAPGNTVSTPLDFVSYPISHSLLMLLIWGAVFGGIYFARRHDRRAAVIIAGLIVSHWALDWITHRPDMPLYPGGPKLGLRLVESFPSCDGDRARDVCGRRGDLRALDASERRPGQVGIPDSRRASPGCVPLEQLLATATVGKGAMDHRDDWHTGHTRARVVG